MYNRYGDINKFITDMNDLKMDRDGGIYLSEETDYGIMFSLDEQMERFEEMKPVIVEITKHICELDNMVQRYRRKYHDNKNLEDPLVIVYFDEPNIITFEYWGAWVNTQYLVVFEQNGDEFVLKSFGNNENIPGDWDTERENCNNTPC